MQTSFGIDAISLQTTDYYLDLEVLAAERNVPPENYLELGQQKMAILPPDQDIVTLAAAAAWRIVNKMSADEIAAIDTVLFATESSIDQSKSAGVYLQTLLNLPKRLRVVELKQACYGGTAGLMLGLALLKQNPKRKILLIASDVARYSLKSAAESSQGAAAVAMLLTANPKLLAIGEESAFYTEDVMDFWRPNYSREPLVDGKYSCEIYLKILSSCWKDYSAASGRKFQDHAYFCYHTPVPKLVEMAHRRLAKSEKIILDAEEIERQVGISLWYGREIGNSYTASLYVGIASLLENCVEDLSGKRIGLYSYGSGCTGEFFSGVVVPGYQKNLFAIEHQELLAKRTALDFQQYLDFYNFTLPTDGGEYPIVHKTPKARFRFLALKKHERFYSQEA
ncbi:MAG: hydroxymethylglutaryl-CoA synthase [Gammaproteobacteria bacterium]